jgi:hypothetical protein
VVIITSSGWARTFLLIAVSNTSSRSRFSWTCSSSTTVTCGMPPCWPAASAGIVLQKLSGSSFSVIERCWSPR